MNHSQPYAAKTPAQGTPRDVGVACHHERAAGIMLSEVYRRGLLVIPGEFLFKLVAISYRQQFFMLQLPNYNARCDANSF